MLAKLIVLVLLFIPVAVAILATAAGVPPWIVVVIAAWLTLCIARGFGG